jgi:precorrin-6B methylase 2
MNAATLLNRGLPTLAAVTLGVVLSAQTSTQQKPYQPSVGQAGKDVVWVPTADALVARMLDMAKLTPRDYLIDLGSGDGRTVIAAAKRGATAVGIEYNPDMVALSKKNAAAAGVTRKATFMKADIFETDYSKATVLTLFLLPDLNIKLRPTILNMKPGTRVVSNSFNMDDWEADETANVAQECTNYCTAYLWIVPAKVDGTWTTPSGDLTLTQQYQMVSGTLGTTPISDGRLRGTEIKFKAGGVAYTGTVNGTSIKGTSSSGGTWTATKRLVF